jgi:U3 small nucleolar RNA-associated protein 22
LVGFLLDAKNSNRVIDQGPSAEQKDEAASFREFWGEKSELRRFKDGSILETLVWSDQPSAPSIVHQILAYILQRHFKLPEESLKYMGDEYDRLLDNWGGSLTSSNRLFQLVFDAFHSLERSLREMVDVPLTIKQLLPASPLLRHTALEMRHDGGAKSGVVDVVLQFESSTRWPDDLAATQMTKLAFLVKIGDYLESSGEASSCRAGLENESNKLLNSGFLDIVHKSHVTFRLRIHHDREQTLLEGQLKNKTLAARVKEETADALAAYKRLFVQGPRLTQALHTLCTRVPALSPTIRVMKHWLGSHLLVPHVSEEFIELLTTRAFVYPCPWDTPSSVMA